MKCREVQDYLITDYLDDELDKETRKKIDNHLLNCDSCSRFYQTIKRTSVNPMKDAVEYKPDESVWLKIKEQVSEEPVLHNQYKNQISWFERLAGLFSPAQAFGLAVCSVIIFLVISISTVNELGQMVTHKVQSVEVGEYAQYAEGGDAVEDTFEESLEYLAYLEGEEILDYGTYIEEYFL